ncbi:uncharacterized protein RHO25_007997 [Cercospora beticola]|uniref:Uncharacterized protein n=1 Tax=Cercospora beticola TaxID=122368 RepID=A0ABZ0NUY0_CERBT|nr:hypothetical protein RHO25_007997 [Cercospora beticola]
MLSTVFTTVLTLAAFAPAAEAQTWRIILVSDKSLSDAEEEELFAFVDAGGESGDLPNHFIKFVK